MKKGNDDEFFKGVVGPPPTAEERAGRKSKYEADTKEFRAAELRVARGDLVRAYRKNPRAWPDGIDTEYDRWYRREEWADDGAYLDEAARQKRAEGGVAVSAI